MPRFQIPDLIGEAAADLSEAIADFLVDEWGYSDAKAARIASKFDKDLERQLKEFLEGFEPKD